LVQKCGGADDCSLYAAKIIDKAMINEEGSFKRVTREKSVLEEVAGMPFLVGLKYAFETQTEVHLITDFYRGGDLDRLIRDQISLQENVARFYICETILAVQQLHEMGIVHRDVKPANLFLGSDGHIALGDYGICKKFAANVKVKRSYTFIGTESYMAPEVLQRLGFWRFLPIGYGAEADWWSVGVVLFEMLTGSKPFLPQPGDSRDEHQCVLDDDLVIPDRISTTAADLIRKLLKKNPAKRVWSENE
jgi:serine/threonine protein kinase